MEQTCPTGHMVPHAPQFARSFVVSVQRSVQNICPVGHAMPHVPALQLCPPPHTVVHEPQCAGSVIRSMHSAPQSICVPGHVAAEHEPLEHTWPAGQAWPQLPQLFRSTWRSAQNLPPPASTPPSAGATAVQVIRFVAQFNAQCPIEHTCPAAHAVVQLPQCIRSVWTSAQMPPHAISGEGQSSAHMPPAHVWPVGHAWSHMPQLSRSVCTLMHESPHIMSGALHVRLSATMSLAVTSTGPESKNPRFGLQATSANARTERASKGVDAVFKNVPPNR